MKIGLVLSRTPVYSETFFNSKIKGLKESGFQVTLYVQKKENEFSLCEVKVAPKVYKNKKVYQGIMWIVTLLKLLLIAPKAGFKFSRLERKSGRTWIQIAKNSYTNYHVLTANLDWLHFGFATMALQSENVARAIGAKMAVSLRGYDIAIYPEQHIDCYKLLWDKVEKIHVISNDLLMLAYKNGMNAKTQFQIIHPAIDSAKFKVQKQKFKNNPAIWEFLTVARLHWKKGLSDTLKALALVKQQGIVFNYKIIGEGDEYDQLVQETLDLGLTQEVKFVGKIEHNEVVQQLSLAQVYLQYSITEGFCNAALEAQAVGCLCIVSDAEGLPENVVNGVTGWVVPKQSPKILAQKIREVLELSVEEKDRIQQQAKKRAFEQFNLEKQKEEFFEFYTT